MVNTTLDEAWDSWSNDVLTKAISTHREYAPYCWHLVLGQNSSIRLQYRSLPEGVLDALKRTMSISFGDALGSRLGYSTYHYGAFDTAASKEQFVFQL